MPEPKMDKLVVLARGLGTRMRRSDAGAAVDRHQAVVADSGVKAMIPIGRPFFDTCCRPRPRPDSAACAW